MKIPAISIEQLDFSYGHAVLLDNINLRIEQQEFFGIIGPNASGKSTLLKLILGLLKPDQGTISVLGKRPEQTRRRIGYVPQFPSYRRDFPIAVEEVVLMGRIGISPAVGRYRQEDHAIAARVMHALEIESIAKQQVGTLSGGQAQRMLIARALTGEPDILVLDEPTANIDIQAEEDIFALLKNYNNQMTIVIVSHDIGFISSYVDRVGCLNRTLVCHRTSEITDREIADLYGATVKMIDHRH